MMMILLASLSALTVLFIQLLVFENRGCLLLDENRRLHSIQEFGRHKKKHLVIRKKLFALIARVNPEKRLQFVGVEPEKFYKCTMMLVSVLALVVSVSLRNLYLFPVCVVFAFFIVILAVERMYQKKIQDFERHLEDGVQNFISSLQAGLNLVQAFEAVAATSIPMVSDVFSRIMDEYRVGLSLQAAVKNMAQVMESPDMHFFSQTMDIYYSSGGDVTEILENMLDMIRRRKQVEGDLEAKTSEVRMTANLLIILPILLIVYLGTFQKDMIEPLLIEPAGRLVFMAGLLLWGTGVIVVKRLTNIRSLD